MMLPKSRAVLPILSLGMLANGGCHAWSQGGEALRGEDPPANSIWVDDLDLTQAAQDWGKPQKGLSAGRNPMTLNGVVYAHGFGTHANSYFAIDLKGACSRFESMVGVDGDTNGAGSVDFQVLVDGRKAADSGVMRGGGGARFLSADLSGARKLVLMVTDAGDGNDSDHADWAGAAIRLAAGATAKPTAAVVPSEPPPPIVFPESPVPAIHGPRIVGASPHKPFLFLIPATGTAPLIYSAQDLPRGLALDPKTGLISGALEQPGRFRVALQVHGPAGTGQRHLTIVSGPHELALTPPMGWNSWNIWAGAVDAQKVRDAADQMVRSGLAAHGFQYVNIDDTWEGKNRAPDGQITTNEKFGDMKALSDSVHRRGLKLGIYSSPGPSTCAGYLGSWDYEKQDAASYAAWGIDYLKYDWCTAGEKYPGTLQGEMDAYQKMGSALEASSRDIFYSLCQYGSLDVWKWGASVGGNSWRTTGDINDSWSRLQGIAFSQNGHEKYAGPGHWNDPDMLVVGYVGWGSPHPTHLKPNEQILHISAWCLLAAPLLIGCDMARLDPFTHALLSNDEVLDIDQDPLGKPAARVAENGPVEVWARPLWDGATAVGLFNRGSEDAPVTANWRDLGISGSQPVRNLWLHKDLGRYSDRFTTPVPAHGVVLVKIGKPGRTDY